MEKATRQKIKVCERAHGWRFSPLYCPCRLCGAANKIIPCSPRAANVTGVLGLVQERKYLVIKAIRMDVLINVLEEIFAMTGKKMNAGNLAFLKNLY